MMRRVSDPFRVRHLQPCNPRYGYLRKGTPPVFSPNSMRSAAATITRAAHPELTPIESTTEDEKRKLLEVFSTLKSELLHDPDFHFTQTSRQWLHSMLDYNVPGGKLSRGLAVINCYKLLHEGKVLSHEENFLAYVLAWCIEWFQACLLVYDDIIDNSYTRRGQPCWFRLPKVGLIAINDALLLQTHVPRILKKHFRGEPYYVQLLDLFNEVAFQTACGHMLDVITPLEGEKDLSNYSMELYLCIAKYKSACYSLYLPVACALILAGECPDDHLQVKDILVEISNYYNIQDDYLDCFGDAETTGEVGTDIEDGKCSWLIVKALEHADEGQKKTLQDNYGKANPTCVAKVKEVYASLNLQNMYKQYEKKSFEALTNAVAAHPSKVVQVIWKVYLGRMIH